MDKVIKFNSLIALCRYIELHGLTVMGWRGDLVIAKREVKDDVSLIDDPQGPLAELVKVEEDLTRVLASGDWRMVDNPFERVRKAEV